MALEEALDEDVVDTGFAIGNSGESAREAKQRLSSRLHRSGERRLSADEEDLLEATAGDTGHAEPILGLDGGVTPHPFGVVHLPEEEEDRLEAAAGDAVPAERMLGQVEYIAARARAQAAGDDGASSPSPYLLPGSRGVSDWSCEPSPGPYGKAVDDPHREMSGAGLSRVQQERIFEQASQELTSQPARKTNLPPSIEYMSALAHLAVFGMLGVLIRYGLEVLFGPRVAGVTGDQTFLFTDLPANMFGSFFMGWVGVVFKKDLARFSELLALGLSTGLMGSITTYASWNQRMLTIATRGRWVEAICGLVIGMQLSWMSLITGMDSAKGLLVLIQSLQQRRVKTGMPRLQRPAVDNLARRWKSFWVFAALAGSMWIAALLLSLVHISHTMRMRLWLACAVAPFGVWARWHLARLNGRGLGPKHWLKWLPVGTLLANVTASWLESGLSTVVVAANEEHATVLVGALQLGLLGCMSTVSTFVVEVHTMHQGDRFWRAYAYIFISIACSFLLGLVTYSVPVWALQLPSYYSH